ncbi:MAG: hypothetical protein V4649_15275 [Bacteroidota bacterium]
MKHIYLVLIACLAAIGAEAQQKTDSVKLLPKKRAQVEPKENKRVLPATTDHGYIVMAWGTDRFMGGDDAMYNHSILVENLYGMPVLKQKAFVELFYDAGLSFVANNDYFKKHFASSVDISPTIYFGFGSSFTAVLLARRNAAIAVGPQIGATVIKLPDLHSEYNSFHQGNSLEPFWGLKASFFLATSFIGFEYRNYGDITQAISSTTINASHVSINNNCFRICLGRVL